MSALRSPAVCAVVAAGILLARPAPAEPAPTWVYADPAAGTCGELWGGDERVVLVPPPNFRRLHQLRLTDAARCQRALEVIRTKAAAPGADPDPCDRLWRALARGYPGDARLCEALGYRYIGKLPAISRPGPAATPDDEPPRRPWRLVVAAVLGLAVAAGITVAVARRRRARAQPQV